MRLLDLFCGAGGAAVGYNRAGFDVVGVDIAPQPDYPFEFHQADALAYLLWTDEKFDAIHASPPCQRYSGMLKCRPGEADDHPNFVATTRSLLVDSGLPYVIENVQGSPLLDPVMLCGHMFGLELYRHRLFESNFHVAQPDHPPHIKPASPAGHWKPGTIISVSGHAAPIAVACEAMGIDWIKTGRVGRKSLSQAIPPAYTEYIGQWLAMEVERAA